VVVLGYVFNWSWVGVNGGYPKITTKSIIVNGKPTNQDSEQAPAKTLWDYLQLLGVLAIPVVAGFGAAWFTAQQGKVSAAQNTANQRETALQAYIDKMSELLLKEHLGELLPDGKADQKYRQQQNDNIKDELKPEYEAVRTIARVRTLTVLRGLDENRKASVLQFLYESDLINKNKRIIDLSGADLSEANLIDAHLRGADLRGADLRGAHLSKANFSGADLRGAHLLRAKLSNADLRGAHLVGAYLVGADLRGAHLRRANLSEAELSWAHLVGAHLFDAHLRGAYLFDANLIDADLCGAHLNRAYLNRADLRGAHLFDADLIDADLCGADLRGAHLSKANFSGADLRGARNLTQQQLNEVLTCQGTILPEGLKHP
jgi:uncharacterized protein YjbI with pentapeptide repeats